MKKAAGCCEGQQAKLGLGEVVWRRFTFFFVAFNCIYTAAAAAAAEMEAAANDLKPIPWSC